MEKLTREEENALWERIAKGDNIAHDEMVRGHGHLVRRIARKYTGRGVPFEDLEQEGNRGLLRAIEKFDGRKGCRLETYAKWWVLSRIQRARPKQGAGLPLSVSVQGKLAPILRAAEVLFQRFERSATAEEIAQETDLPVSQVEKLLKLLRRRLTFLDAAVPGGDGPHDTNFGEITADPDAESPDAGAERQSIRELLSSSNGRLSPRERRMLELRFGLADGFPRILSEVGEKFEMTGEGARLILVAALSKLRGVPVPKKKRKPLSLRVVEGIDANPLRSTTDKGRIIESVCRAYGIVEDELRSKKRHGRVAWARKVAFYLLATDLGMYPQTIAEQFGEKRGVAVYAIKAVDSVSGQNWWREDGAKIRALYESVLDLKIRLPSLWKIS